MKKTYFLFLLFAILPIITQAQFSSFGAKAGGGFSTAVGNDAPSSNINYKAGLHAGLMYNYEFVSRLSVQPELMYSRKGFVYDDYPVSATEAYAGDIYLDYLELPLLLKIQKAALFLEAGPYFGYLLNAGSDVNVINVDGTGGTDPDIIGEQTFTTGDFNRFDAGYAIGAGLILDNGFFMSVRHTGGLRSISSQDLTQRNLMWQLSIGFLMPVMRPTGL